MEVYAAGPDIVVVNETDRPLEVWVAEAAFLEAQAEARAACSAPDAEPGDDDGDVSEAQDRAYLAEVCVRLDAATSLASSLVRFPVPAAATSRHRWLGKVWLGGVRVRDLKYVLRSPGPETPVAADLADLPLAAPLEVPTTAFAPGHGVAALAFGDQVLSVTEAGYARASLGYDSRRALAPEAPFGWVEERVFALPFEGGTLYAWGEHLVLEHHGRTDTIHLGDGSAANVEATIVADTARGEDRYLLLRKEEMSRGRATSGMCGAGTEAWLYLLEVSPRGVGRMGEPFLFASCMQSIDPDETQLPQHGGIVQPRHLYTAGTTDCVVYDTRAPSAVPVALPTCPP